MDFGNKIEKRVDVNEFTPFIQDYTEQEIHITDHALFRLQENERKIFKEKLIKEFILGDTPFLAGIQENGNYALFYEYGKDVLKLIVDIQKTHINIVTFYIIDKKQLPRI